MGQRSQVYVIQLKDKEYSALGAFHHQWCYGLTAASNAIALYNLAGRAKTALGGAWEKYTLYEPRQIRSLVTHVYGVDFTDGHVSVVHDEAEFLIKDGFAHPELADNNDGCALLLIDEDKKELRLSMFTPEYLEGSFWDGKPWKVYTPKEYVSFYYQEHDKELIKTQPEFRRKLLNTTVNPVSQREFNRIFRGSIFKEKNTKELISESSGVLTSEVSL